MPSALDIERTAEVTLAIDQMLAQDGWTVQEPMHDADYQTVYAEKAGTRIRIRVDHRERLRQANPRRRRTQVR